MPATLGYPNIAFVGKAGSGKTTASQLLDAIVPDTYQRTSFAAPLKKMAVQLWGQGADSDRAKLQGLGVAVRDIEAYTWARLWVDDVNSRNWMVDQPTVVDDLRFENEWWAAKGIGFVTIRVVASRTLRIARLKASGKFQDEAQLDHVSETSIDHLDPDYTISNDGGKFGLADQLVPILNREAKKR